MFVLLWKYTMRAYTGEVYMLIPSFNLYGFCLLTYEGSYPASGGKPVAKERAQLLGIKITPPVFAFGAYT